MAVRVAVGIRRHRLYQEILAKITQLVQSGEVQVGSVFPSEKDLAERYGVSVSIIREAFRVLEHTGLVQGKQGGRRYLVSSAPSFGSLLHGMELVVQRDLMEARRAIEVSIVRLAAARCQPEDVEHLREMVEQEPSYTNNEAFRIEDMRFHQAVADVAHNSILSRLQQYINDLRAARQAYTMSDETRKALRVHHLPLVMALAANDPEQAEQAMIDHLEIAREAFDRSPEFRAGQR